MGCASIGKRTVLYAVVCEFESHHPDHSTGSRTGYDAGIRTGHMPVRSPHREPLSSQPVSGSDHQIGFQCWENDSSGGILPLPLESDAGGMVRRRALKTRSCESGWGSIPGRGAKPDGANKGCQAGLDPAGQSSSPCVSTRSRIIGFGRGP